MWPVITPRNVIWVCGAATRPPGIGKTLTVWLSDPRPVTARTVNVTAATPTSAAPKPRIRLRNLIHRSAAEAVRRANQRTEQLAHVRLRRAIGQQELGAARTHEATSLDRSERAVEQRSGGGCPARAVGLGPQTVADIRAPPGSAGHGSAEVGLR